MYCKHGGCKKFKLYILPTGEEAVVKVYSTSKNFNHKPDARYTTQIRGAEQKIIRYLDRETVTKWLRCFKDLVIAKDPSIWPPFKNVVTDFSWAFMHGISKAWNSKETIFEYLDMCHRILTGRETLSSSTVVITSCTNHYVKNILNHIKRYYPDDEKQRFT
ncbi:unnamed protein product [Macrosiphum euphorbiae]|uniref:Transposase n=1 Tax=Macrosiphum euphorbiae TaxID=13131 RepID=A0AAV0VFG7_9HEMI|nr:unnamed protein product [Macrosiphum euphorbiae]